MPINCTQINKLLVQTFRLLGKYEDKTTKFEKLATVFGTLIINEKLLLRFCSDYELNSNDLGKIVYFKNTDFDDIFVNMSAEERNTITSNMKEIYTISQRELLKNNTESLKKTYNEKVDFLFKNPMIRKMMGGSGVSAKKFRHMVDNNKDLRRMLEKFDFEAGDETMLNMIDNILGKGGGALAAKLLGTGVLSSMYNDDNIEKFKNACTKMMEQNPELMKEIEDIVNIFTKEKLTECVETIAQHIENIDLTDITKTFYTLKQMLDSNKCVQDVVWKFHMTIESGLLNIDRIKTIFETLFQKALIEFKTTGLITNSDYSKLAKVMTKRAPSRRKKKGQRRNKRMKKWRREHKTRNKRKMKH